MLGLHLTLDMYGCRETAMDSQKLVYQVLDELPGLIGMHKISEPQIMRYGGKEDSFDKGGLSGFVIIAESHISAHTFIAQRHASIDIFSCKDFDVEKAIVYLTQKFSPQKIEKAIAQRGKDFPKDLEVSKRLVGLQRKSAI